ncbi:DUF2018 family protein [Helicobacter brantae]|uniref:DUF2018 domain-containing protein n=1 Tax=Helicobacter brantae TaxID=375927 RepID=A0A3D8J2K1_9HELI|nr:DUF2018 family protein [Helicobacter brantae]RDU70991.1 DUF2018 domain-containing protein [Helicobacter brantae]
MLDEIFEGSAIEKWKEIVFHANPSVVGRELERLLEELAKAELVSEGKELTRENIAWQMQNLAITSMSEILSQNE